MIGTRFVYTNSVIGAFSSGITYQELSKLITINTVANLGIAAVTRGETNRSLVAVCFIAVNTLIQSMKELQRTYNINTVVGRTDTTTRKESQRSYTINTIVGKTDTANYSVLQRTYNIKAVIRSNIQTGFKELQRPYVIQAMLQVMQGSFNLVPLNPPTLSQLVAGIQTFTKLTQGAGSFTKVPHA